MTWRHHLGVPRPSPPRRCAVPRASPRWSGSSQGRLRGPVGPCLDG